MSEIGETRGIGNEKTNKGEIRETKTRWVRMFLL
jgi:hypothetical protein